MIHPFWRQVIAMVAILPALVAAQDRVRDSWIAAAVDEGLAGPVAPYDLRGVGNSREVVGWVYTPRIRVARFVHERSRTGTLAAAAEIPASLLEPVLHVVLRVPDPIHDGESGPFVAAISRPEGARSPSETSYFVPVARRLLPALRMETLPAASQAPVFTHASDTVVGVFPISLALQPMLEFCVYREYRDSSGGPAYHVSAGYAEGPLR